MRVGCRGLGKTVTTVAGSLTLLEDVSLGVGRGESLAVTGASGSGKSTLLGLLAGLDLPTSGRSWLCGASLTELDEESRAKLRGASVGFVFQSFQLLAGLTALENVMLPLELRAPVAVGDMTEAAREQLRLVGLADRTGHYPRQLSGGEQQRVALARAFVAEPEVLFADEPTGNLDSRTGAGVMDLLFSLNVNMGTTLVLATHDAGLAARCDRRVALAAGRLVN